MAVDPQAGQTIAWLLERYRSRIRSERRFRYVSFAALASGVLWLGAAVLYNGPHVPTSLLTICFVVSGAFFALALAVEALRGPTLTDVARVLDPRLDDRQRLVTSVEILARHEPSPIELAQVESSVAMLARLDPRQVSERPSPAPVFALGVGLACLAFGLLVLKGLPDAYTPVQAGKLDVPTPASVAAVSPTAQPGLPGSEKKDPQNQAGADPSDPANANRQAEASKQAQDGLKRLEKALDEQSMTQGAADSLREGKYGDAAKQLEELGKQNDQLSDAAKQGLSDSLRRAAEDPSTPGDLKQAEQRAADSLQQGDFKSIADGLKGLGDQLQKTAGNILSQQELAGRFPEQPNNQPPGQSQGQQPAQGQQGQGQGQQPQQDPGQGQGQQAGDAAGGSGQQGQQGGASGTEGQGGAGQDNSASNQQGNGAPGGAGSGASKVSGPSQGAKINAAGNPFELQNQPNANRPGDSQNRPGLSLQGSGSSGGAYAPEQGGALTTTSESNNLPVETWQIIQRYFGRDR